MESRSDPRKSVQWFAEQMEAKLRRDDESKVPWETDLSYPCLFAMLLDETLELYVELCSIESDNRSVIQECSDIANFAMMIACKFDPEMQKLRRGMDAKSQN